jgi:Ca2+-binding EF-hand superfamily protein
MKQLTLVLSLAAGALVCGCVTTSNTAESTAPVTLEARFARYDLNKDGKIVRAELGEINTEDAFYYYDSDGNKIVTTAEWLKLGGKPEVFKSLDRNGDGQLTLEEAKANPKVVKKMSATFETVDVNKDGAIDLKEAKNYQVKRQEFTP